MEKTAPQEEHPASDHGDLDLAATPAFASVPPIAAEADDLEAIKKAVDDAASVSGALWVSYLFVLFYLAVAAGAVTHADLFLEKPVKLPFLGVELPLFWFFVLAPFLFVIVHAYALVHLVMLTNKAKRFDEELRRQIGKKTGISTRRRSTSATASDGNCRATSSSSSLPARRKRVPVCSEGCCARSAGQLLSLGRSC